MSAYPTPVSDPDYVGPDYDDEQESLDTPYWSAEPLAVEWLINLRDVRGLSENTLLAYNQVLRFWIDYCDHKDIDPLRPTLDQLEAFMIRKRAQGKKGAPATQNGDASCLRGWYKWMHERGKITANPAADLVGPKRIRGEGRPIEDRHWQAIWSSELPPRLRAVLGFGFYCGLRRHELGGLTTDMLTPTKIVRFKRKGGGKDTLDWYAMAEVHAKRLPHLLPDLELLTRTIEHVRVNYDKVLPWQNSSDLYYRMRKLCDGLEIPRYTPHQMRHSTATNLLRAGVPHHIVMRMMNHSSFDITMRYVRAQGSDLKEWLTTIRD